MSKTLKVFFYTVILLSLALCFFQSVAMATVPGMRSGYGKYLLSLPLVALFGAAGLTLAVGAVSRREDIELRFSRARIADMERLLKNLEEAANRREEFIASFAHELKTPLTAIIGYADMLRSKEMAPKSRFTAAGYIFSEGKRLEALSLKLMDIIVVGKQNFEKKRYEAGYLIREVAAVTVPSLSAEGLILDIRWDKEEILVEPDLFKTLLINLVDNARKASRRGQHIELYGRKEEGGYSFFVKDYGRGMKAEEIARIAEPFYMIDKSRSRSQNGAGLGLALCQRIAELHGTQLSYESVQGEGTTVKIRLRAA